MSVKILLADDHSILRDGLRALLEGESAFEVVGITGDGQTAVEMVQTLLPDVVLMDLGMPELNGVEATRRVVANHPDIKVIALSVHSGRQFVSGMLSAGASGYLLKTSAFDELATAIRTVMAGQTYLSPKIAGVIVDDYVSYVESDAQKDVARLTPREREVLQLLTEGKSSKEVAARLHVSVKTVDSHRQNMMKKLDIHTLPELTKYALREGLTSLEG